MSAMSIASSVRFSEISGLLERISKSKKSSEKKSLLTNFISQWREYSSNNSRNESDSLIKQRSFFPVMRLIMPTMDRARSAYGIQEVTLAKLYSDILCLGENHPDSKRLMHFRSPRYAQSRMMDFAEVAYEILKNRSPNKGLITIEEVNKRLDNIAEAHGQSKRDIIHENLVYIFQNTNALDQKWLIRIFLKDLSIGISNKTIFQVYHPSAEHFYNVTNDLEVVCNKLQSSASSSSSSSTADHKHDQIDIDLFHPFKPMLSSRADVANILTQLDHQPFMLEIKFDGERVQLHKLGTQYRYWSRTGLEWTKSYGNCPSLNGTLTPFIHSAFQVSVDSCILDGEMMGYNMETHTFGSKAEAFDVKNPNVERSTGYCPCFVVFDVLYLNGQLMTNRTLEERKRVLDEKIFEREVEGRIVVAKWKPASTREEVIDEFNRALEVCEEGILVKRCDSIYVPNLRAKSGWLKIKPDYVLGMHEEIDCIIVGGYFGGGRVIRNFLCAVKGCDGDEDKYLSFTRVGSGFTRRVLYEFNMKMIQNWKIFDKDNPPPWLVLAGSFREKPDVYTEPENSFIIQLKAAEIINSENYAAGCTLRFVSIDCFREDKSPTQDCMTIDELNALRLAHKGKLALHPLEIHSDEDLSTPLEETPKKRAYKRTTVPENFKSSVPTKKLSITNMPASKFHGKEFCVLLTDILDNDYDKKKLETFVYTNGGLVVQNPTRATFAIIVNKVSLKVQNLLKNSQYDIVSANWLVDCANKNTFVELTPSDFFGMKKETVKNFNKLYDAAGDSYTRELSTAQLKVLLEDMDSKSVKVPPLSSYEKSVFLDETMIDDLDAIYLNGCVIYFYMRQEFLYSVAKLSEIERLKCILQLAGARIATDIKQLSISHVVLVDQVESGELSDIHSINRSRDRRFHLVSLRWVVDSIGSATRMTEHSYFANYF